MPLKIVLVDLATGQALHSEDYFLEGEAGKVLLTTSIYRHYGVFKTASYTVQGTTEQVTPSGGGSLELTDFIISFEKKGSGVVNINFHDGTVTVPIIKITLTDAPVSIAHDFAGHWHGWADAHIDVVISGADSVGTVAIGYVKHPAPDSLSYSEWNARR
jgi:hypothetical protein